MQYVARLQQTASILYQLQDMDAHSVRNIAPLYTFDAAYPAAAEKMALVHFRSLGLRVGPDDFILTDNYTGASPAPPPVEGPTPISLDVFLAQARATIDAFEAQWREGHATVPEQWPMQMWPGDWWEQLSAHDTSNA